MAPVLRTIQPAFNFHPAKSLYALYMSDWPPLILYLPAAFLTLLLPGSAVLAWLPKHGNRSGNHPTDDRISGLSVFIDAAALSISVSALAAMIFFFAGLRVSPAAVGALYGLCLLALLGALFTGRIRITVPSLQDAALFLLAVLFVAALVAWRFYQARALALAPWVDSVHHTLIVRLIMEWGGLPPDFQSYLPVPFYYHYGFHLVAALFAGWTGLQPDQVVLWFGQVINALVALSVYRFAEALVDCRDTPIVRAHRRQRALFAALLVGLAFQMPAYYLTWGRFTMLMGLVLLGPALATVFEVWREPVRREGWLRLVLLTAGLSLTHYFTLLLLALFLLILGLFWFAGFLRRRLEWGAIWPLIAFSALGALLAVPWLWRMLMFQNQSAVINVVNPFDRSPDAIERVAEYLTYLNYLIGPDHNRILLGIASAGLLLALTRAATRPLFVWTLLIAALSLPWGLRLGPFRPDHFAIVLFFPASILLANLIITSIEALKPVLERPVQSGAGRQWIRRLQMGTFVLLAAGFAAWGMSSTRNVINESTLIATHADTAALEWIHQNIPPDARFYNNSVPWQAGIYRGVDGGYWLLPYTGRQSMIPPIIYNWGEPAYVDQIARLAGRASQLDGCTPQFWELVRDANLSHVYLREGQGNLQPQHLADCPRIHPLYAQNGVYIYEILKSQ